MFKANKRWKKLNKLLFCALLTCLVIVLKSNIVNATTVSATNQKSDEFQKWEQLSEEEKSKTIQPMLFNHSNINMTDPMNWKVSRFNAVLKAGALQSSYCIDKSTIIVKNQQKVGSCWAFVFSSMFETTAYKNNNTQNEYSPEHIDYSVANLFGTNVGDGGNYYLATAYNALLNGPVFESDFPFNQVYNTRLYSRYNNYLKPIENVELDENARGTAKNIIIFPEIYKEYSNNQVIYTSGTNTYTSAELQEIRNEIKQHIINNGAIGAYLYSDMGTTASGTIQSTENFFNATTNAYYCNDSEKIANHAVTIVGWDDNYSRNNFNTNHKPIHDGAYIVLNSWGDDVLDDGFFYVSYDDICIEQGVFGIEDAEEYEEDCTEKYNNIYCYDELGESSALNYSSNIGYMSNVFNRIELENNEKEELKAVGVYLWNSEGIEVYICKDGTNNINNATKIASYVGNNSLKPGFHILELESGIKINSDQFSIIVKYISNSFSYPATAAIECNYRTVGFTDVENYYDAATSEAGESFYSNDGRNWTDLYYLQDADTGLTYKDSNACIRAYTKIVEGQYEYEKGDINKDGNINITDGLALKRYVLDVLLGNSNENTLTDEDMFYRDMDENTYIDVTDVLLLKRKILDEISN